MDQAKQLKELEAETAKPSCAVSDLTIDKLLQMPEVSFGDTLRYPDCGIRLIT